MPAKPALAIPRQLIGDKVAEGTSWEPLQPKSGASYRTHSANRASENRLTFDGSFVSRLMVRAVFVLCIVNLLTGAALTFVWLSGNAGNIGMQGNTSILKFAGPGFMVGALFFGVVGFFLNRVLLGPIVFDRQVGLFWQGSGTPVPGDSHVVDLNDIYALQVLEKWIKQSGPDISGGYTSFELNLVTASGQRHNVIDHGEIDALRDDATRLAEFLDRPLWDTTVD